MNYNPIRRSPIKRHPRQARTSWRSGKIRLDAAGMKHLRQAVFARSSNQCENTVGKKRCPAQIFWGSFHLAHIISRGRGGSDTPENTLACCMDCHAEDTANRRKLKPHPDWIAG